jgi:hypothetical protein
MSGCHIVMCPLMQKKPRETAGLFIWHARCCLAKHGSNQYFDTHVVPFGGFLF